MVTAYPVAFKKKSMDVCLAFVRGCGGQIGTKLRDGPTVFYGIDASNEAVWHEVKASGREFWYIDNSMFDASRQTYVRVTKNRLQHTGVGTSDGKRFCALGIDIAPWRTGGAHIVVCPQSDAFMRFAGYIGHWTDDTLARLKTLTDREIRVRPWSPNKGALAATLSDDLRDAHALVTWSSAAAVTAVLAGVPVVTMGQCAAAPMAGTLEQIESLPRPDRENWAGVLADQEWTLAEMSAGIAWRKLDE